MSSSPLIERPPQGRYSPRHEATPARACADCAAALSGPFCAECGQRDGPPDPSLRELVGEAWDAFVSIDGKVVSAIRLLLARPGALTLEYLQGRRVRYLPPLRLYLVCSVLYFLVAAMVPDQSPSKRDIVLTTPQGKESVFGDSTGAGLPFSDSLRLAKTRDTRRRVVLEAAGRPVPPGPLDAASSALADSLQASVAGEPAITARRPRRSAPPHHEVVRAVRRAARYARGIARREHDRQCPLVL